MRGSLAFVTIVFRFLPSLSRAFVMSSRRQRSVALSTLQKLGRSTTTTPRKRAVSALNPVVVVTPTSVSSTVTSELSMSDFQDLEVSRNELRPSATLTTGQCFHWKSLGTLTTGTTSAWGSHNATEWVGVVRDSQSKESIALLLRETPTTTLYRVLTKTTPSSSLDVKALLQSYFQLDISLQPLYEQWSNQCSRLKSIAMCIPGVRVLDQDPWECLVSFICSSNNNIPRITKMLNEIRKQYGDKLVTFGDETLYSFPSLEQLAVANEADLRAIGLGYRAKYIVETIKLLQCLGGEEYLYNLRSIKDPAIVQEKLLQFAGVGRKVADCVALFSLQQYDAIPVDVHVWNIAVRDYDDEEKQPLRAMKSLTPTNYQRVANLFRTRFPIKSGWAHSLLFVAELPSFRPALPQMLVQEMDAVRIFDRYCEVDQSRST